MPSDIELPIRRGIEYLIASQRTDGSFGVSGESTGDVGITGLAVQALASGTTNDDRTRLRSVGLGLRYLESRIQPDGFAYDPPAGLRTFKTAMAARAFRSASIPRYLSRAAELEARIEQSGRFESDTLTEAGGRSTDSTERLERLRGLAELPGVDDSTNRAVEFLLQCEPSAREIGKTVGPFQRPEAGGQEGFVSYDGLTSLIYRDLRIDDPDVVAVLRALSERFTLAENPDLTRRFSRRSQSPGEQGLFFNYYVLVRVLSLLPTAEFRTSTGEKHHWIAEVSRKIISLQRPDGSWMNPNPRWWEGSADLATAYAVLALRLCEERRLSLREPLASPR